MRYFKLNKDHSVSPLDSLDEYESAMDIKNRIVKKTRIDHVEISTVFLGYNFYEYIRETPLFFETMVFGGHHDGFQNRYPTWDEAVQGHKEVERMHING